MEYCDWQRLHGCCGVQIMYVTTCLRGQLLSAWRWSCLKQSLLCSSWHAAMLGVPPGSEQESWRASATPASSEAAQVDVIPFDLHGIRLRWTQTCWYCEEVVGVTRSSLAINVHCCARAPTCWRSELACRCVLGVLGVAISHAVADAAMEHYWKLVCVNLQRQILWLMPVCTSVGCDAVVK